MVLGGTFLKIKNFTSVTEMKLITFEKKVIMIMVLRLLEM